MRNENGHEHHIHNNSSSSVAGAILGIAIGAAVTYLFANKDGQKIRDTLLKEGKRLLDEAAKKAQEAQKELESTEIKEEISEKIEEIKKSVGEVEQIIEEEVPTHIEQIQKKGRRFFIKRHQGSES